MSVLVFILGVKVLSEEVGCISGDCYWSDVKIDRITTIFVSVWLSYETIGAVV